MSDTESTEEKNDYTIAISEGYIFKQLIDLLVKLVPKKIMCFYMNQEGFIIKTGISNDTMTLIIESSIFKDRLLKYTLNTDEELVSQSFNSETISQISRTANKDSKIGIVKNSDRCYIDIDETLHDLAISEFDMQSLEDVIQEFTIDSVNSEIVNVCSKDFSICLKSICKNKDEDVVIIYDGGITMQGVKKSKITSQSVLVKADKELDKISVKISNKNVKTLKKIFTMTKGVIGIHIPQQNKIILTHSIGSLGDNKIYISSNDD
jgi:hypothetical protein